MPTGNHFPGDTMKNPRKLEYSTIISSKRLVSYTVAIYACSYVMYVYIYIYIYIYVCVCVCVCVDRERDDETTGHLCTCITK
jgi:hypothetical protein